MTEKLRAKNGRYYDLIKVPHGHIPTPLVNLWSNFPIPVKERRGWDYYYCRFCGTPSFFKGICRQCEYDFEWDMLASYYQKKKRREYFRKLWKRLEYLYLPLLVLTGKAWYVRSKVLHPHDLVKDCERVGVEENTP